MSRTRHHTRSTTVALAATVCLAGAGAAAEPALDRVLEGAEGDRVTILLAAGGGLADAPVTLCLFDGASDARAKGFDIRVTAEPRFWTIGGGEPACGGVSDAAHTVSFFARSLSGTPPAGSALEGMDREILRTRLDLGGLSGRRVDLIWTLPGSADAAAPAAP